MTLTSRGLLGGALALALGLTASVAHADPRVDARRHFRTGMQLIGAGQYEAGIAELETANEIKPHPAVVYNIAKAYLDEGKVAEAIDSFERYLSYEPPDASAVSAKVEKLRASIAPPPQPVPLESSAAKKPVPASAQSTGVVDAATQARLDTLLDRLDAAVSRAESLEVTPAAAPVRARKSATPSPSARSQVGPDAAEELGQNTADAYEEVVVTASRHAESALEAPASTTTITSEEIQLSGATGLPDLLRRVPGVDVMQLGVGSANVSIRGFNQRISNKLLVLIDGRSVYEDFLGFTLFDEIPIELDEIERIEIIRGPGSALYGANAFMGVVNIITKRPGTGPTAMARAGAGSGNQAEGSYVASQRLGRFSYRASAGYSQADKWSVDFAGDRADYRSLSDDSNLGLRSARANAVISVALAKGAEVDVAAGVNKIFTEIYPLGLLRNFFLDGVHLYNQADLTAGPFKVRAFWNHLQASAGPQYNPVGQFAQTNEIVTNVLDADAQLDQAFKLAGDHHVNLGVGYRLKTGQWDFLGSSPVENHFSAFVQEEYRPPLPGLALSASVRADRHPLLNDGHPGFAVSPRGSVVYSPFAGQAFHLSAGTAFRDPTFVESYTHLETPVPGQPSLAVLTDGNTSLQPEKLLAVELGYRAELSAVQLDVALYRNEVKNLVEISPLAPLPAGQDYDASTHQFLVGRSTFINDVPVYTALGGELGVKFAPIDRMGLRGSFAVEKIGSDGSADECGPCSEVPAVKLYAGASYRTSFHVDLNLDASYVSSTRWIERSPDPSDLTQIAFTGYPLQAYAVVDARVAYQFGFAGEHLEAALVGSNLAASHQEHPFGNLIDTRVLATLGGQL